MKKYLLYLCLCICAILLQFPTYAQTKSSITGVVRTSDGSPAANVNISVKGTSLVTQTDDQGKFYLKNVSTGTKQLKVSGVGLKHKEISIDVKEGLNTINSISISESSSQLEAISIRGYKSSNNKPTTLGKVAIPARDLPQAVQVITTQVIEDQQADRLGDIMKNANGVALGANRGGVGENFFARGYSLGANNTLKNGARTTIGGSPEASTLESVEILKGSAALLYGGVTGGAVVNMITKKPKFENGGAVSFRTGSYDQYKGTIDAYGPLSEKLAYRVIATGENAGSFRQHVGSERFYINPSLLYKISDRTDLLVQGDFLLSNYTPDFGVGSVASKIVDFGRDKFLNTPWAYNKTKTATTQAHFNHQLSENWKVAVIGSMQAYDRNYFGAERLQADAAGIASRNLTRSNLDEFTFNEQINLNGTVKTGAIKHTVLVGVDGDQSRNTSRTFSFRDRDGTFKTALNYGNLNVFDPKTYEGDGYVPQTIALTETFAPVFRYGVFVQDLIALSEKFKVLAGVRWTYQKTPTTDITTLATGVKTKGTAVERIDKAYSPKFGLIYQPAKSTSLYVSYANNFTPNTGTDINLELLKPSIIDQYEAGIKNDFLGGRLSANLTYYKVINNNIAQTAEFDKNGNPNADTNIKQLNGETTSDGVELDVTGAILPGLNFLAGYSYNYMRYTNTAPVATHTVAAPTPTDPNATRTIVTSGMIEDVRLVGTTKHTANASLFYTVQNGGLKGLKLGASAFYTGDRNGGWNDNKAATTLRLIPIEAFTTFDVSAGYSWSKFSILGKLSNITNELSYFVHENYSVNPIPPRQFVTTLQYKF